MFICCGERRRFRFRKTARSFAWAFSGRAIVCVNVSAHGRAAHRHGRARKTVKLAIAKPVMADLLRTAPECLNQLSELLAHRKMETEGIVREANIPTDRAEKEREDTATFLKRLRLVL